MHRKQIIFILVALFAVIFLCSIFTPRHKRAKTEEITSEAVVTTAPAEEHSPNDSIHTNESGFGRES
jgi:regulatory protein YycI of two-component signal transduction system YycFG